MTYAELTAQIKYEAKIENDSNWSTPLQKIVYDCFWQLARTVKDPDNYVCQHSLTSAAQDATTKLVKLPVDFAILDTVEFSTATATWDLPVREAIVPPALETAKPKCYEIYGNREAAGAGNSNDYRRELKLFPTPYTMVSGDALLVSYYRCPVTAIGDLVDAFKIHPESWLAPLTTMAVNRIEIYTVQTAKERVALRGEILQMGAQGSMSADQIQKTDEAS